MYKIINFITVIFTFNLIFLNKTNIQFLKMLIINSYSVHDACNLTKEK